jgi:hypothetical protein
MNSRPSVPHEFLMCRTIVQVHVTKVLRQMLLCLGCLVVKIRSRSKLHRVSIACNQCRKRKVRCDVQTPRCQNCLLRGQECVTTDPRRPNGGPVVRQRCSSPYRYQPVREPTRGRGRNGPDQMQPSQSSPASQTGEPRTPSTVETKNVKCDSWATGAHHETKDVHLAGSCVATEQTDIIINTDESSHNIKVRIGRMAPLQYVSLTCA